MKRFIDFDASCSEAADEPLVVRFQGRDWTLYPALPAKPVLRLLRLQAAGGEELSQAEMMGFLAELVPGDVLDAWLDGGMTVDQMSRLLKVVMNAYRGGPGEAEGEAPAGQATRSSSTGQS
jgi:hypothetical protein